MDSLRGVRVGGRGIRTPAFRGGTIRRRIRERPRGEAGDRSSERTGRGERTTL